MPCPLSPKTRLIPYRHDFAASKVDIITGEGADKFTFLVSTTLLMRDSPWFRAHFWFTHILNRPEIKSDNFSIWITWLHSRSIDDADEIIVIDPATLPSQLNEIAAKKTQQLAELYALGVRFECAEFQNYVVSRLVGHMRLIFQRLGPKATFGLEGHMLHNLTAKKPVAI